MIAPPVPVIDLGKAAGFDPATDLLDGLQRAPEGLSMVFVALAVETPTELDSCPINSTVQIAYLPATRTVQPTELARAVDRLASRSSCAGLARRIAELLEQVLCSPGVIVVVEFGVSNGAGRAVESAARGCFVDNRGLRREFSLMASQGDRRPPRR